MNEQHSQPVPPDPPASRDLEFGLLGPVEVRASGRQVPLFGSKARALLALLLLRANTVVSTNDLAEGLWADEPPQSAHKMIHIYVSRLRALLDQPGSGSSTLLTRSPGYVLQVAPGSLDLWRFESLVAQARAEVARDPGGAADRLRGALGLFRGSPLSDVAAEPFALAAITRLKELRFAAEEERFEAELAAGRHREVVGELKDLVTREPLRERLRELLILALYRGGRQAEALEVMRETRTLLREELGIDPSPELRRLELAILRQEPELQPPPRERKAVSATGTVSPAQAGVRRAPWPLGRIPGRRLPLIATGLAISIAVGSVALWQHASSPANPSVNSAAILDPRTWTLVGDVAVGSSPGSVVISDGSAWIGDLADHTVTRIDLASLKPQKIFGLPAAPVSLTAGRGVIWVGDGYAGTLSRILVDFNELSAPFFPGASLAGLLAVATNGSDLWVGLVDGTVLRLDATNLATEASISLARHVRAIALTDRSVWTVVWGQNEVQRIDPGTASVSDRISLPGVPVAIVSAFGSVWVATTGDDRLWRIDTATDQLGPSIPLGIQPDTIAVGAGAIWIASGSDGIIDRIDPGTATLQRTFRLDHHIGGLAVADDGVWITLS